MPSPETWSVPVTLAVLALTVFFFTLGRFRSDIVAVCALLALMIFGVLTPQEALSGFANPIIMTVAAVFIVGGAIVRSGLANVVSARILRVAGKNQNTIFMLLMLVTAVIGSVVSNTGTVAIMMPIVVSVAAALNASPSRFLMPLAFMSSIGGMLTLIGNPGNMVVNDVYMKAGFPSLSLFSFLPVGVICLAFGVLVLTPLTSLYLARRKHEKGARKDGAMSLQELADKYQLTQNLYKIAVPAHSPLSGESLSNLNLTGKYGVFLEEVRREIRSPHFGPRRFEQMIPGPQTVIRDGDILYAHGSLSQIQTLVDELALELLSMEDGKSRRDEHRFDNIGICELVIMSSSRLAKRTVAESGLREQFGVSLLGIQRGDRYILDNLKDQVMQPGDSLLVQGAWDNITRLDEYSQHWVVVGRPQEQIAARSLTGKIPFVVLVLLLMLISMAAGFLPTVVSVMLAAVLMIAGGCFKNLEEAYATINWETVVMISCMLPMAIAMEKTGLVAVAAQHITALGAAYGPLAALAMIYGVTSALNIVISGTPVALLVAPVGIQVALDLGFSPLPFVFGVATAACMCFASPFSTPSNALVMSAGRYTFFDYLKIGLPLQIALGVIIVLCLPLLFPF